MLWNGIDCAECVEEASNFSFSKDGNEVELPNMENDPSHDREGARHGLIVRVVNWGEYDVGA